MIPITTSTDLLKAKPINEHILKFGRNEVNLEVAKYVNKCIVGLGLTMDNYATQILIEDLVDKYKYDSIEDIQECLKKGRRGEYGTTYNKLNMIVISEWMAKHLEQKSIAREKQHNERKKGTEFDGWNTREEYEAAARKPTIKSAKDILKEKDEDYQRFKANYEATKGNESVKGTIKPEEK